jgi:hypothetical protein
MGGRNASHVPSLGSCAALRAGWIEWRGEFGVTILLWFSNDGRLAVIVLVAPVFFILVIVGVPRWHRGADEAEPSENAFPCAWGHVGLSLCWSRNRGLFLKIRIAVLSMPRTQAANRAAKG